MEAVSNLFFGGSPKSLQMVTAALKLKDSCSLGKKISMTNLDSTLKNTNIILLPKVHLVKAMVFPLVIYGCESWTIRKAQHRRIGAFELFCWRRLLGISWATSSSNQSILREVSPEFSLEGLMLKLRIQYFGQLI